MFLTNTRRKLVDEKIGTCGIQHLATELKFCLFREVKEVNCFGKRNNNVLGVQIICKQWESRKKEVFFQNSSADIENQKAENIECQKTGEEVQNDYQKEKSEE